MMVRLAELNETTRTRLLNLECPTFESQPWVTGAPLARRRVAILSTAGLHRRGDRPFTWGSKDYRVISGDLSANELVMSHVSVNFDRIGFQQDLNVIFPLDRLRELATEAVIGSVAAFHYSFMGATTPQEMEPVARGLAALLKRDGVAAVLLVPV
jgi:D-proline reductase (dithiol) PrdB